jgi:hypothetical protein
LQTALFLWQAILLVYQGGGYPSSGARISSAGVSPRNRELRLFKSHPTATDTPPFLNINKGGKIHRLKLNNSVP